MVDLEIPNIRYYSMVFVFLFSILIADRWISFCLNLMFIEYAARNRETKFTRGVPVRIEIDT